jgi:hypothetical protein
MKCFPVPLNCGADNVSNLWGTRDPAQSLKKCACGETQEAGTALPRELRKGNESMKNLNTTSLGVR